MQFTPKNAAKVMAGTKTQTRRVRKDNEYWVPDLRAVCSFTNGKERIKWQVGKVYAIQPGRGKPAIGYAKLTGIRLEELQDISLYGCTAELGETMSGDELADTFLRFAYADLWDSINPKGKRWADNHDVWALTFEVVP